MMKRSLILAKAVASIMLLVVVGHSAAQPAYPAKPIRFIIPFAPGGGNDIVSRIVCQQLAEAFRQSCIPDNRAGAGGIVGTEIVAKATPDGYTLGMGTTSTFAINPALVKNLSYDPVRDFAPVTMAASNAYVLAINSSVPARTVAEFIALAKAKPGTLNYSSAGNGSTLHLAGEIFKNMAGVDLVHIPYKGMGPGLTALIAGEVQFAFAPLIQVMQPERAGQLRMLGISSLKRSGLAPDLPTLTESGVKGYDVAGWYGVVAPANTPRPVILRLNQEIVKILNSKSVTARLVDEGTDVVGNSPEQFGAFIKTELAKWTKAVRDAKITLE